MAKISFKIPLPEPIKKKDRVKIESAILDYIVARTMNGFDKNNNKFTRYSKDYAQKKGVSRGDVDLVLSGEMLSELKVLKSTPNEIEIGYKGDSELIGKVEGNILGTYGNPEPVTKGRDFLGIDSDDLEVILDSYNQELEDEGDLTEEDINQIAKDAAREILGDINFDEP